MTSYIDTNNINTYIKDIVTSNATSVSVTSNLVKTVDISINGDNNKRYNIICGESHSCIISCNTMTACTFQHLWCFGKCSIICDNVDCPKNIVNFYTYPSKTVAITTTTVTSPDNTKPGAGANSDDDKNNFEKNYQLFTNLAQINAIVLVCAAIIIYIIAIVYHKKFYMSKAADIPRYFIIFKTFGYLIDLWTDIFFCAILYVEQNKFNSNYNILLFYCSIICLVVPYFVSCTVGILWINRWKLYVSMSKDKRKNKSHIVPIRFKEYLNRYENRIYLLIVLIGFYPTIDLLQTKLFYLDMFHLPLQKDENKQLRHLRFLNIVLFEVCVVLVFLYLLCTK